MNEYLQMNLNTAYDRNYNEDYPGPCTTSITCGTQTEKTSVYLLRHCQSEYNAGNKKAIDPPLTNLGLKQASKLQGHFDVVLCSPLTRTMQTLHASHITYGRLMITSELREWRQADCDFFPHEQTLGITMETADSCRQRICYILDRVRGLAASGNKVLLIGHLGFFKLMTSSGSPSHKKRQKGWALDNGQMVKYSFQ